MPDVICELGYSNRHLLRNWYKDYLRHGEVCKPRFYSDEEKRRAVDHFLEHGRKPSPRDQGARAPSERSLYEWVGVGGDWYDVLAYHVWGVSPGFCF